MPLTKYNHHSNLFFYSCSLSGYTEYYIALRHHVSLVSYDLWCFLVFSWVSRLDTFEEYFVEHLSVWVCLMFSHEQIKIVVFGEEYHGVICSCSHTTLKWHITWLRWYLPGFSNVKLLLSIYFKIWISFMQELHIGYSNYWDTLNY